MTIPTPTRPALRYFGGKWRIGKWIISHFPDHYTYVEPFGGGASVLLQKNPSPLEVYNDIDGDVVNYFRVLRDHPDELIRAINLTPFSREEYNQAFKPVPAHLWFSLMRFRGVRLADLERARQLYIRSFQSYASHTDRMSGWRWEKSKKSNRTALGSWNSSLVHLEAAAARMRMVQIENDDVFRIIKRYDTPNTLFYLDPPYIEEALSSQHRYKHSLTEEQHTELLTRIQRLKGMVAISMVKHHVYQEMLSNWEFHSLETRTQNGNKMQECLWLSPSASGKKKQLRLI